MTERDPIVATRLLLVEDDDSVAAALAPALAGHGFTVERVSSGAAALVAELPDLVLLDLGLPDIDGVEVCRRLRHRSDVPIIAVTARAAPVERVRGLRSGADDYVTKPFSLPELVARIEAVLRRTDARRSRAVVALGSLVVDRDTRGVAVDGVEVGLTRKEFELLVLLADNADRVLTRAEILEAVWHTTWEGNSRTLDVHIAGLRHKLGPAAPITTVRGVGYRFGGAA